MGTTTNENEYLFRAKVCLPVAIFFAMIAVNSFTSSGILLFQVIFVLMALYFSLSTLAYAAFFTNDYFEQQAEEH